MIFILQKCLLCDFFEKWGKKEKSVVCDITKKHLFLKRTTK